MDVFEAIKGRRSCRRFLDRPVEKEKIMRILDCANYAPSPANKQPWEFIVVTHKSYHEKLRDASEETRKVLADRSGWKWMPTYRVDFVTEAPVLIAVVGDPARNGAEQFLDEPAKGYEQACSAAIQNMMLAAYAEGLQTLWFSLFEKKDARAIFGISEDKDPLAVICVGYPEQVGSAPPRKDLETKVRFIE